jgi:hypothetical protein
MIVNYECGCCGSGDNVTLNCPVHGKKIKYEKTYPAADVERLVEAAGMVCKQSFDVDRLYTDECDALDALKAALAALKVE